MVDVAHDLGCLGENGRGHIGMQDMVGKIDIVMGSFSKTFASNGGFVASHSRAVKEYMRYYSSPNTFSNALSPAQAATIVKAFDIVDSDEGSALRRKLMNNIIMLRAFSGALRSGSLWRSVAHRLREDGHESLARLVSRRLPHAGLLANLVEFPAVPKGAARFRLQVMANHTEQNIADAVGILKTAKAEAARELESLNREPERTDRKAA